ncbi:MAG TPA: type II toxin-antitoxin system VapC family toxin [Rhizomicrobium sp.]|nr:type II toxin-antitoxin system VapC family toxin [Rhizomicrobium sp.]
MIILDTNVLSEPTRAAPSIVVRRWLQSQAIQDLYTTAITEAEMMGGVAILPAGRRRDALTQQVERLFGEDFQGRILAFDEDAARAFPAVARVAHGRPMMEPDRQIAAIARAHGATLATRNIKDFAGCGLTLVNPWTE